MKCVFPNALAEHVFFSFFTLVTDSEEELWGKPGLFDL